MNQSLPLIIKLFFVVGAILGALYLLVDFSLLAGLKRLKRGSSTNRPRVSVFVSARNEEQNIDNCLSSLLSQSYPSHLYEVLIANDRSEDRTEEIVKKWIERHPGRIQLLSIESCPEGLSPKKQAISQLIEMATGEIICATDADCIVPPRWIEAHLKEYEPHIEMVVGHSEFDPAFKGGWLQPVQALEFLSHSIIAAGSIGAGYPLTCTGNNLSYRKKLFEKMGGYSGVEHILSGNDDLLLRKVAQYNPRAIQYCLSRDSFVTTQPQLSGWGLLTQRSRWASTTITYETPILQILIAIFSWYCWIIIALLLGFAAVVLGARWGFPLLLGGVVGFVWKSFWDEMVTRNGARLFRRQRLLTAFIPTALLHIPMIVFPVVLGLCGNFQWKGRSGQNREKVPR